jgi:hypothetical protein
MIKVIDNFISHDSQLALEQFLIGNNKFPYYYCLDTIDSNYEQNLFSDNKIIHQPQFVHVLCNDCIINSEAFDVIFNLFNFKTFNLQEYSIKRAKVNLLTPPLEKRNDIFHVPHFDSKEETDLTMLYYVTDSDGDTYFFNEIYNNHVPKTVSLKETISPQRGRAVFFNSNRFHASSPPLNKDYRCVLNVVFTMSNNQ